MTAVCTWVRACVVTDAASASENGVCSNSPTELLLLLPSSSLLWLSYEHDGRSGVRGMCRYALWPLGAGSAVERGFDARVFLLVGLVDAWVAVQGFRKRRVGMF